TRRDDSEHDAYDVRGGPGALLRCGPGLPRRIFALIQDKSIETDVLLTDPHATKRKRTALRHPRRRTQARTSSGSVKSTWPKASADPRPMRFTIAMVCAIVIVSGRTLSSGRYIALPERGVGACGRNTATQPLPSGSST